MSTTGFIFSNLNSNTLSLLTSDRTVAAIPFGCRYRLVDFALSNMVNSDITDINIIANYNFRSLVNHIGSGKDWDLARRSGGIKFLPPNINWQTPMDDGIIPVVGSHSPVEICHVMSNAFGFGGNDSSIILSRYEA